MIEFEKLKMSKTPKEETPTTQLKKSDKNSTTEDMDANAAFLETLQQAMKLLQRSDEREKPLRDFHEATEASSDSDIRIYWDVRVVQGKNTPFTHTQGSTSLPGILSDKLRPHALAQVQHEINDKITGPTCAAFMEEIEHRNLSNLKRIANRPLVESEHDIPTELIDGSSKLLSMARQQDNMTDEYEDDDE